MHTIANPQDRQAAGQDRRIASRRVLIVNAGGSAGEDEALDIQVSFFLELRESGGSWKKFAVDMALTHAAGDQPAVLGTIVENNDRLSTLQGLHKNRFSSLA